MAPAFGAALGEVRQSIERCYTAKVLKYGATALGVGWSSVPSQELRFIPLLQALDFSRPMSLNDVGCGYGALLAYIGRRHRHADIDYCGTDVSLPMIEQAKRKWRSRPKVRFEQALGTIRAADYSVASGIFNINVDQPLQAWEDYVATTLDDMRRNSRAGFAVNFMAPHASDLERSEEPSPFYRVPPARWKPFCERELACTVQLVEGYGLREYTLLATR